MNSGLCGRLKVGSGSWDALGGTGSDIIVPFIGVRMKEPMALPVGEKRLKVRRGALDRPGTSFGLATAPGRETPFKLVIPF